MPIHFECPCGKKLQVRDELAGKRIKCPTCGAVSTAPGGKPQGQAKTPTQPAPRKPLTRKATAAVRHPDSEPEQQPADRGSAFPSPRLRRFVLKFDMFAVLWVLAAVLYALWDIQGQVANANRGRSSYQGEARVPHDFQEFVVMTVVWAVVCLWADRRLLRGSGFWLAWPGLLLTVIHEGIRVSFFYDLLWKRTQDSPWLSTLQTPLLVCVMYVLVVLAYHYVYVRVLLAVRRDGPLDEDD